MAEEKDNEDRKKKKEDEEIIYGSWSPDGGIVLEWMGRAEGISDEQ